MRFVYVVDLTWCAEIKATVLTCSDVHRDGLGVQPPIMFLKNYIHEDNCIWYWIEKLALHVYEVV